MERRKIHKIWVTLLFMVALVNVTLPVFADPSETRSMEHLSAKDAAWCDMVVPKSIEWFSQQEAALLPQGRSLSDDELALAQKIGVQHAEQVRIIELKEFPSPQDPVVSRELKALGMFSPRAGGFSMGYAVLVKPKFKGKRWLLTHEFAHIAQRERLGTEAFVRQYLLGVRIDGYKQSPLEVEADKLMSTEMPMKEEAR